MEFAFVQGNSCGKRVGERDRGSAVENLKRVLALVSIMCELVMLCGSCFVISHSEFS